MRSFGKHSRFKSTLFAFRRMVWAEEAFVKAPGAPPAEAISEHSAGEIESRKDAKTLTFQKQQIVSFTL